MLYGVSEIAGIISNFKKPTEVDNTNYSDIYQIRNKIWDSPQLIDDFLADSSSRSLSQAGRKIISDWRANFLKNDFIIMKYFTKYSVMMMNIAGDDFKLFGVTSITNPIKKIIPYPLPIYVETVLLPFENKIIYDSFIAAPEMAFGPNFRSQFDIFYKAAKAKYGVIEKLGGESRPHAAERGSERQNRRPRG
ncbi:MAG: hypothetical protein LBI10_03405 [Deltaproteobacteria bacterium]|nr:hypothetical protein [Deltaproteobacteria bacterium]